MPKSQNLTEVFWYIRENPLEYLPEKSLSLFNAFWIGYEWSYNSESNENTIFRLPEGFYKYIDTKYKNETTHGPFNVIKLYARNEAEAFDNLFYYLDDFVRIECYGEENFYVTKPDFYKFNSFFDFLRKVQKRPAMYVGQNSFTLIAEMLHGWFRAIDDFQLNESEEEMTFRRFQNYIEEKGLPLPLPPWNKIIWYWTMNEEDSLVKFFEYFDEFAFQGKGFIQNVEFDWKLRNERWKITDLIDFES